MPVKEALEAFAARVQQQARSNLTKAGKNDTGGLYDSVSYDLKIHKSSFSLSFNLEDYGTYIDKGVKGFRSANRAPNSPFQFGTGTGRKGGLTEAMDAYVRRKRIQFRDTKTGKFTSYESTAFLIARSIYNKGIEATNFFTRPFENEFKKLPGEIVQAYGLEVETMLKRVMKK